MKMKKNFTQIPNEILESNQLSPLEIQTYCTLLKYCHDKEICFPSQKTLSKNIGRSKRHIRTTLQNLQDYGLIQIVPQFKGRTNGYLVSNQLSLSHTENSSTPVLRSRIPLEFRTVIPPKNTNEKEKEERGSKKGIEILRKKMSEITNSTR